MFPQPRVEPSIGFNPMTAPPPHSNHPSVAPTTSAYMNKQPWTSMAAPQFPWSHPQQYQHTYNNNFPPFPLPLQPPPLSSASSSSSSSYSTSSIHIDSSSDINKLVKQAQMLKGRNKQEEAIKLLDNILNVEELNFIALKTKGLCLKELGRLYESIQIFEQLAYHVHYNTNNDEEITTNHSTSIDILTTLAQLYKDVHRFQDSISCYLKIISLDPSLSSAKTSLAIVLTDYGTHIKLLGDMNQGMQYYQQALAYNSEYAPAYYNLGVAYSELAQYEQAIRFYETAIKLCPNYVEAHCNLGVIAKNMGRLEESVKHYRAALLINPNFPIIRCNIAIALNDIGTDVKNKGDVKKGIKYYKESIQFNPKYAEAYYNLGVAYSELNKPQKAIYYYQLCTAFNEKFAEAYNNMGVIYKQMDNISRAIECYNTALVHNPTFSETMNNLGVIYTIQGKMDEGLSMLQRAIYHNPMYSEAYNNIGVLYRDEGNLSAAMSAFEKCISLQSDNHNAAHNRLLAFNYDENIDIDNVFNQHKAWGDSFQSRFQNNIVYPIKERFNFEGNDFERILYDPQFENKRKPRKKLKIGYISGDYFTHSVSYFIEAPLKYHSRESVEVYCYSNVAKEDDKTQRLRNYGHHWRSIVGYSTQQLLNTIQEDGIDVLVELTGHTAANRLDVMASRAAPVQITWIGYPNTTGLSNIDYRFTDRDVDPLDTPQQFTETLVRLPSTFLCYTPHYTIPEISQPPSQEHGIITFGTFNNMAKINDRVIRIWARILNSVPESRLLLKSKPFSCERVKSDFVFKLQQFGVHPSRIDLMGLLPQHQSHLSAYSLIDISLDVFPYAGTTTTCEALLMGVPVITLRQHDQQSNQFCHAANVGVSLLSSIGCEELIADSEEEYVSTALRLAHNTESLAAMRKRLREKMLSSPLCDGASFTSKLESVYHFLWNHYDDSPSNYFEHLTGDDKLPTSSSVSGNITNYNYNNIRGNAYNHDTKEGAYHPDVSHD